METETLGLVGAFETVIVVAYDWPVFGLDMLENTVVGDTEIFATAACDRETAHRFQQEERSFRLRSSLSSNNKSKYENTTKRIHFPLMIVV